MRLILEDRRQREIEVADDRRKREEQFAEERRMMREQLDALRALVERPATSRGTGEAKDSLKLAKLGDEDDIEAYLTTFERMMAAYEVEKRRWTYKLAPQLSGRAQQAFAAMEQAKAGDYEEVKAAILRRYDINEETYRQRFRAAKKKEGESHRELAIRLQDAVGKWTKDCTSVQQIREAIVTEQLLSTLPEEIRVWVKERKPKTSMEAGVLADDYIQARKAFADQKKVDQGKRQEKRETPARKWCRLCESGAHWTSDCPKKSKPGPDRMVRRSQDRSSVRCFKCDKTGHIARNCPEAAHFCGGGAKQKHSRRGKVSRRCSFYREGTVDGKVVSDILLDTGCSHTLISKDLVPDDRLLDRTIEIQCAHGDCVEYPLAEVEITIDGKNFEMLAGVAERLPAAMLLGEDVPGLWDLLGRERSKTALVVTTRAAAKRKEREAAEQARREASPEPTTTPLFDEQETDHFGADFDDELFSGGKKSHLSRRQNRANRQKYVQQEAKHPLEISAEELQKLQEEDPTLSAIRKAAKGDASTAGVGFFKKGGLLYRRWIPPGRDEEEMSVEQLILPQQCRGTVLQLAHKVPIAGHMGKTKTARRILQRFYWPSLFKDVADYCKCCPECQKCSTRKESRAPLYPCHQWRSLSNVSPWISWGHCLGVDQEISIYL